MEYMYNNIETGLREELPEGIAKRVRILNPIDPPRTGAGAKVFDFDKDGKLIDVYFEGTQVNKVYTYDFSYIS
jgi:hypothetical protein